MLEERDLETVFRTMVKKAGGVIYKVDPRANRGAPDRVVTINGRTSYVELKTETGKLSPHQQHEIEKIRAAGGAVAVLYGRQAIEEFVRAA